MTTADCSVQAQREQSVRQREALFAAAARLEAALQRSRETAAAADEACKVRVLSIMAVHALRDSRTVLEHGVLGTAELR